MAEVTAAERDLDGERKRETFLLTDIPGMHM